MHYKQRKKRPSLQGLIKAGRPHPNRLVLALSLSRIFRDREDTDNLQNHVGEKKRKEGDRRGGGKNSTKISPQHRAGAYGGHDTAHRNQTERKRERLLYLFIIKIEKKAPKWESHFHFRERKKNRKPRNNF